MEDFINESNVEVAVTDTSQEEIINRLFKPKAQKQEKFIIDKFPKEFKRDILKSIDIRFIIILLFSSIVHILSILYLGNEYPGEVDAVTITRIQQQYVDLLLENESFADASSSSSLISADSDKFKALDTKTITGLAEWMDVFANKALEAIKDMPAFKPGTTEVPKTSTKETDYPTKEEIRNARNGMVASRVRSRSELEKEISTIGLLGLIGSKKNMMDYEYIEDLLEYADLNDDHLATVLSKLKSIQVPRHSTAGHILKYKRNTGLMEDQQKGGRQFAENDNENVIKNIDPLVTAKEAEMKRVVDYEEIPSENPLAKLRSRENQGKTRSANDVIRVVQSHKRALQDCYKQELKVNSRVTGKIVVRFTVNPEGIVIDASVVTSTLRSPGMEACIIRRIKNWRDFGYSDPTIGNITYKQVFNFDR